MNGVRINGELIRKEGKLRVGDELHIGDVGYRMAVVDSLPKKNASAAAVPIRKPMITPDPRYLSQDVPVAMPDEGQNFVVEETSPKMKAVPKSSQPVRKKKVIELSEDDILDE
jgi:hypothetical protein